MEVEHADDGEGGRKKKRMQILQFLSQELFDFQNPIPCRIAAVKNCELLMDKGLKISQADILPFLIKLVETELDDVILRSIPDALRSEKFVYDSQMETLLQKILAGDDKKLSEKTLNVVKDKDWIRISLVEKVLQMITVSSYLCKVSVCELLGLYFSKRPSREEDSSADGLRNEEREYGFKLYMSLCQDSIPMVRIVAITKFSLIKAVFDGDEEKVMTLKTMGRTWILEDMDQNVRAKATEFCLECLEDSELLEDIEQERLPWFVAEKIALQLPAILERCADPKQHEKLLHLFLQTEGCVRLAAVKSIRDFVSFTRENIPVLNLIQLYIDPEPRVRRTMISKSPQLLEMLEEEKATYDALRKALFTVAVNDPDAEVRTEAIVVLYNECIQHFQEFDEKPIKEFYNSIIAFKASWKPLWAAVRCIRIALKHHPHRYVIKLWSAAISHHVAILRGEALEALQCFEDHFDKAWVLENIGPLLEQIIESTKRHMVRKSCRDALDFINK